MTIIERAIRKLLHKQYAYGQYKTYQEYHEAETKSISERIRAGGGHIGKNADFYEVKFDNNALFSIGDNVTITQCRLLTHDACLSKITGCIRIAPIIIGDNVFIGADSVILPGTKIGSNVIVGAGCVVGHDIPDNSVVIGNPCRIICSFDDFVEKEYKHIAENGTIKQGAERLDMFNDHANIRHIIVNNDIFESFLTKHQYNNKT